MAKHSIADLFDLSGKVAIVTGAAQGIGAAIAERLAEAGASVVLAGHNQDGLDTVAAEISAAGGKSASIAADVCDMAGLDAIVAAAVDGFSGLDILVNAVGGMHPFTPALELSEEVFDATLTRNVKSCLFLSQKAARESMSAMCVQTLFRKCRSCEMTISVPS